jgi:CubicO group peptidase (beta-lactamase class C family)
MKKLLGIFFALVLAPNLHAAESLPRSTPEAQGVSSVDLQKFVGALNAIPTLHGFVVVRHGRVITEGWWSPYDARHQHTVYSLSKSFTSTAVGLAIAEGKLHLDDPVLKFFPEDAPANPGANLKSLTVRDLLTMSSGQETEITNAPDQICPKLFLAQPVTNSPGTRFKYSTADAFMLSAIVQKVTGQNELDYLRPRLFEPLGIEQPLWDTNFQGIAMGGTGLHLHTEDIAKLGQLYLQHGNWHGRQLIPSNWVAMATSFQISNINHNNSGADWHQGYGFMFWRCRHNCFRGDGAYGQFCLVMPDEDAVVAINSGTKDMQVVLDAVWNNLLPAMQPQALPANPAALKQLQEQTAQLEIAPVHGAATSALMGQWLNRKFIFPANAVNATNDQKLESISLAGAHFGKTLNVTFRMDGKDIVLPCGYGKWKSSYGPFLAGKLSQLPEESFAGTYAWPDNDTCDLKICALNTPFHLLVSLKFQDNQVTFDLATNEKLDSVKPVHLVGQAE